MTVRPTLWMTIAQVALFAGVKVNDVRRRTKSVPGREPLFALQEPGIPGDCFDAANVAKCYPQAARQIIALLEAALAEGTAPQA